MDIIFKAVNATITDTSASADEFPGTFEVELSNESIDRDGDTLKGDEWETPLPERITFVNDHTHKMKSVVGSAVPSLVDGKILCKGDWAATDDAQDTRKVIPHVPYVSVAYREKRNQKSGTVSRELVNGSFVVVPSNTKARVLSSKSFGELDDDTPISDLTVKQFGEMLDAHKVSPAPEGAPPKDADPQTDRVKDEAAALDKAKAAALEMTSVTAQSE